MRLFECQYLCLKSRRWLTEQSYRCTDTQKENNQYPIPLQFSVLDSIRHWCTCACIFYVHILNAMHHAFHKTSSGDKLCLDSRCLEKINCSDYVLNMENAAVSVNQIRYCMLFTEWNGCMLLILSWEFGMQKIKIKYTFLQWVHLSQDVMCSPWSGRGGLLRGSGSAWLAQRISAIVFAHNVSAPQTIQGSSTFPFTHLSMWVSECEHFSN